jgi:hypothetical protein
MYIYTILKLKYHVVIQYLFAPLDKDFVVLNNRNISLGQTFKQERYKYYLQVYLGIILDREILIGPYTHYVCIENLCLFQKITLHICTPVACVLLFRIKNIILSTSSRYHSSSKRQQICHCSRNSLLILTNVLFIGEFLTKSNAKLSFSDNTYSKMSRRKFWLTTL